MTQKTLIMRWIKNSSVYAAILLWASPIWAVGGNVESSSMDFVWKIVNFAVLVGILYFFARKPIRTAMRNSAEAIQKSLEDVRIAEKDIDHKVSQMKIQLMEIEKETQTMVEKAKIEAEEEKKRIIAEGEVEVQRMTDHARFTIEQEYKKAKYDLKQWMAELTVKVASKKVQEQLNTESQRKLVNQYLDHLESSEGAS